MTSAQDTSGAPSPPEDEAIEDMFGRQASEAAESLSEFVDGIPAAKEHGEEAVATYFGASMIERVPGCLLDAADEVSVQSSDRLPGTRGALLQLGSNPWPASWASPLLTGECHPGPAVASPPATRRGR